MLLSVKLYCYFSFMALLFKRKYTDENKDNIYLKLNVISTRAQIQLKLRFVV